MQRLFWQRYKADILGYDLLGEPSDKFDYVVYYSRRDPFADTTDYVPSTGWDDSCSSSNDDHDRTPPSSPPFTPSAKKKFSTPTTNTKSKWQWKPKATPQCQLFPL